MTLMFSLNLKTWEEFMTLLTGIFQKKVEDLMRIYSVLVEILGTKPSMLCFIL